MRPTLLRVVAALATASTIGWSAAASAQQATPAYGRLSVNFQTGAVKDQRAADGRETTFREVITSMAWRSAEPIDGGAEFAFDGRGAAYPGTERRNRMSVYDGFIGYRVADGRMGFRAGQMWINDLGAIGALAGALVEVRRKPETSKGTLMRAGVFGGLEPSPMDIEYARGIRKGGGYVAIERGMSARHVLGYVNVRNRNLTERSVLTTTNFLSMGRKLYVYQVGEYDLVGVGGNGGRRLSYFLTNARASVVPRLEVQGSYHRGRSVDTRSLSVDVLQGAPISTSRVEGLLFESVGGRLYLTVAPRVRVNAGYSRDKTNSATDGHNYRYHFGANAWNLAGFDVHMLRSSNTGAIRNYSAWDASLGRPLGSRLYLTADYSTNLSSLRLADNGGGFTIEHRPRARRYGGTALANLTRHYSLLLTVDATDEGDMREHRELAGITVRF